MGEIRLFHQVYGQVFPLESNPFPLEEPLREQIEKHLLEYLGVCFLDHEVVIGASELDSDEEGRIDTLGIDTEGRPVIVEYKRNKKQDVVQQVLDYRDWLLKNRPMFRELVRETDQDCADKVVWQPRLIVIAGEITQKNLREAKRNKDNTIIELVCYRRFGDEFLTLEWVYGESKLPRPTPDPVPEPPPPPDKPTPFPPEFSKYRNWDRVSEEVRTLFQELLAFAQTLGEIRVDVYQSQFSFRRMKAADARQKYPPVFATVRLNITMGIRVWVLKRTQSSPPQEGLVTLTTDYWIININNRNQLEKAMPLLREAYERY